MTNPTFRHGTFGQDVFTLETRAGRANLFQRRIDEILATLKASGKKATLDDALFELRTSEKPEDRELLEAMGVATGWHTSEQLRTERTLGKIHATAKQTARGAELSSEAKAALKTAQAGNVAVNERRLAFNRRIDALTEKGFTLDQAILQMRANPSGARLLEEMSA